jgi:hypothetical protein
VTLQTVDTFGAVDADTDDLLLDCFQDHEAYKAALEHKKFLIVGRKGSGKTAIFRKIVSESGAGHYCHGHSFSNYPWFHHNKQIKSGVPESECFRYSWEYVILISIAKIIVNDADTPWSDESLEAMTRLETFLVDTYGSKSPELDGIFLPQTRIKLDPALTKPWGTLPNAITIQQIDVENLPVIIYEVNKSLLDIVTRCLNPNQDYHVCFDELDRNFSASDINYRLRLSGLLIAARDFNRAVRQAGKRMSVIVFLRDDILRHLKFEDKNKILEDSSTLIEWDKQTTSRSLKDVMSKRFSRVLGIPESGAWEAVFNEDLQMTGRQSKYQYILDRTFKRPRDIIKFSNEVLRCFKQAPEGVEKFQNAHVASARETHSKYMRKELVDEMQQHFPEEEAAFDLIRTIGSMMFTLGKIDEVYEELTRRGLAVPSVSRTLRELYNFSAIAFLKVGGAGGGSEWVWRYEDTDAEYDERATIFRVHSGLKEVLGLKQGRAFGKEETEASVSSGGLADDLEDNL